MPAKKPTRLPEQLRYMQPFVNSLAKLPADELNEDIDASRLEAALRRRVRGLEEDAAETELAKDIQLLKTWLKTTASSDHPAHWVLGYLSWPDLASHLIRPPEPPPKGPEMTFEAPDGWKVKPVPFRLDLKKGKIVGSITAIDKFGFELLQRQREYSAKIHAPELQATTEVREIQFGKCFGKKYLYQLAAPMRWKQVDYVLRVPGGYVSIFLSTLTGADFDELPLEARLETLRLSAREKSPRGL